MCDAAVGDGASTKRGAIFKDPRIKSMEVKDLVALKPLEKLHELTISVPWLLGSVLAFQLAGVWNPWWLAAGLVSSFYFFLTGLRQVHNAHHHALGISRRAHDWLMWTLSILMMSSMHAIQVTHLHHHRHCLSDADIEGSCAKMPWYRAIGTGPLFILRLHYHAFLIDGHGRKQPWIFLELASMAAFAVLVFGVLDVVGLQYFVMVMLLGQCLTGFFAVWTVHHHCDEIHIGRTQRGRLKNLLSYHMFLHVEHHLFPAVPTCHQPELTRRLEAVAPELRGGNVY